MSTKARMCANCPTELKKEQKRFCSAECRDEFNSRYGPVDNKKDRHSCYDYSDHDPEDEIT